MHFPFLIKWRIKKILIKNFVLNKFKLNFLKSVRWSHNYWIQKKFSKLNQKIPIITGNNLERKVTWCWTCRTIGASCMGRLFPFCECTPLLFFPFFTPCYSSVSASSPGILPSRPPPSLAPPPIKPQEQPVQSVAQQASKRSVAIFVCVTCESSAIYQCIEFYSNFPCKYLSEFHLV